MDMDGAVMSRTTEVCYLNVTTPFNVQMPTSLPSTHVVTLRPPPGFTTRDAIFPQFPAHIFNEVPAGYQSLASMACSIECQHDENLTSILADPFVKDMIGTTHLNLRSPFCSFHENDDRNERLMREEYAHLRAPINQLNSPHPTATDAPSNSICRNDESDEEEGGSVSLLGGSLSLVEGENALTTPPSLARLAEIAAAIFEEEREEINFSDAATNEAQPSTSTDERNTSSFEIRKRPRLDSETESDEEDNDPQQASIHHDKKEKSNKKKERKIVTPNFIPFQEEEDGSSKDGSSKDDEERFRCCICFDEKSMSRTYEGVHGHPYHTCIECFWRVMREKGTCPYCRARVRIHCSVCNKLKSITEMAFNVHGHEYYHMCAICLLRNKYNTFFHCGGGACPMYVSQDAIHLPLNFHKFELAWTQMRNAFDAAVYRFGRIGNFPSTLGAVARFRREYF